MNKGVGITSKQQRSCSFKLVVLIIIILVMPLFIQIALLRQQNSNISKDDAYLPLRRILYEDLEVKKSKIDALETHLKELDEIKFKTLQTLTQLDKKRFNLLSDVQEKLTQKNNLESEIKTFIRQVQKMKKEGRCVNQDSKFSQKVITNIVHVGVPRNIQSKQNNENFIFSTHKESSQCTYKDCFDYSKCSILKTFSLYTNYKSSSLFKVITSLPEFNKEPLQACIHIVQLKMTHNRKNPIQFLSKYRNSKENNVIILEKDSKQNVQQFCNYLKQLKKNKAILVTPFLCNSYRTKYDYILPDILQRTIPDTWKTISPLFPVNRRYILSFNSMFKQDHNNTSLFDDDLALLKGDQDVFVKLECLSDKIKKQCTAGWCICDTNENYKKLLNNSKFTIIPLEYSNPMFFSNIIDVLQSGCVPIFIGSFDVLPFSNVIDWKKVSLIIHYQRLPELLFTLRSMPIDDIITLKQQGRFLYETYFSSKENILRTMVSHIKQNIGLPPTPLKDFKSLNINNVTGVPKPSESLRTSIFSQQLKHNFSFIGQSQYELWNSFPGALNMYPIDPWKLPPPSEIQFLDEGKNNFMPIGDGKGGDGAAFARSLGGDYAAEQFTILMLTYDREIILMEALQRLSGMKYLNKVVVVWNNPVDPSSDLQWPEIGVKLEVVRAGKNSLNNRFIPYDVIDTEAILSMDDDIYLRHDEIELAFRIWRENRDRLVGFPGRHHAYNSTSKYFYYDSEHSCELSLVLTGGAFFHKYYSYVYTYKLDNSIKEMVDEFMNCEDIAMNFLVAHITKKPPIKVTSRWTFRCPGCPVSLSADANHYKERNQCMEYFQRVYGYNPLKRTQFRADSILFKTRIPNTLSKCFQFV